MVVYLVNIARRSFNDVVRIFYIILYRQNLHCKQVLEALIRVTLIPMQSTIINNTTSLTLFPSIEIANYWSRNEHGEL